MTLLSRDGKRLKIFENYEQESIRPEVFQNSDNFSYVGTTLSTADTGFYTTTAWVRSEGIPSEGNNEKLSFKEFIKKLKKYPLKVLKLLNDHFFNPSKFFKQVKESLITIKELKENSDKTVNLLIEQAKLNGQIAYSEYLEKERSRIVKELILIKEKFSFYIDEEDIINFSKNSNRKIKLDYLKNFCRLIPDQIQQELLRARNLKVFDNFLVLHYDPKDTGTKLTKKEEEKKKDPILFGTFKESTRLYFIGDWIDDYCNLTLDVLLQKIDKKIEEKVLVKNKIISNNN